MGKSDFRSLKKSFVYGSINFYEWRQNFLELFEGDFVALCDVRAPGPPEVESKRWYSVRQNHEYTPNIIIKAQFQNPPRH